MVTACGKRAATLVVANIEYLGFADWPWTLLPLPSRKDSDTNRRKQREQRSHEALRRLSVAYTGPPFGEHPAIPNTIRVAFPSSVISVFSCSTESLRLRQRAGLR